MYLEFSKRRCVTSLDIRKLSDENNYKKQFFLQQKTRIFQLTCVAGSGNPDFFLQPDADFSEQATYRVMTPTTTRTYGCFFVFIRGHPAFYQSQTDLKTGEERWITMDHHKNRVTSEFSNFFAMNESPTKAQVMTQNIFTQES